MFKTTQSRSRDILKVNLHNQAGVSAMLIMVVLAVSALALVGGATLPKYIEEMKATNDMGELTEIRAGLIGYASRHNSTFTGFTLDIGCRQRIFAQQYCTGTGAGTTVANMWGGQYEFAMVSVSNGNNNGARLSSTLVPDAACIKEISTQWNEWSLIGVGNTTLKQTVTQVKDETAITDACANGANTIQWTVRG